MHPSGPGEAKPTSRAVDLVVGASGSVPLHKAANTALFGANDACSFNPLDHGSLASLKARLAPLLGAIPLATAEGVPASMRVTGTITKRTRVGRTKIVPTLEPIQVEAPSGAMVDAKSFEQLFPAQFTLLTNEIWKRAFEALSPARGRSPRIRFLKSGPETKFNDKLLIDFSGDHSKGESFEELWISANMEPGATGIYDMAKRQSTTDHHPTIGRIGAVATAFPWGHGPFHLVATLDLALKQSLRHALAKATEEVVDSFLRGSGLTGFTYSNLVTRTKSHREIRLDLINWIRMSQAMLTMNKSWRAAFNLEAIGDEVRRTIQAFEGAHLRALSSAFSQVSLATLDAAAEAQTDYAQLRAVHGGMMPAMVEPSVLAASLATNIEPFVDPAYTPSELMASFQSAFLAELSHEASEMIRAQTPRFLGTLLTRVTDHLSDLIVTDEPVVSLATPENGRLLGEKWAQMLNLCASCEDGPFLPATSLVGRKEFARFVAGTAEHGSDGRRRPPTPQDTYCIAKAHLLLSTSMRPMAVGGEMAGPKGGNSLKELAIHVLRHRWECLGQHPTGFAGYVRSHINQERQEEYGQDLRRVPSSVIEEISSLLPSLSTDACDLKLVGVKPKRLDSSWKCSLTFKVTAKQGAHGESIRQITGNGETVYLAFSVDKNWFDANSHWQTCATVPDQHLNARQAGELFPKMIKVDASGRHTGDSIDVIANAVFGSAQDEYLSSQAFGARIVRHAGALSAALNALARSRPHLLTSAMDIAQGDAPSLEEGIQASKTRSWATLGKHLRASLKSGSVSGVRAVFMSKAKGKPQLAGDEGSDPGWATAFELLAREATAEQVTAAGIAAKHFVRPNCLDRAMDAAIERAVPEVLIAFIDMGGIVNEERIAAIGLWHDAFKDEKLMSKVSSAYMRHAATQAMHNAMTISASPVARPARLRAPCL